MNYHNKFRILMFVVLFMSMLLSSLLVAGNLGKIQIGSGYNTSTGQIMKNPFDFAKKGSLKGMVKKDKAVKGLTMCVGMFSEELCSGLKTEDELNIELLLWKNDELRKHFGLNVEGMRIKFNVNGFWTVPVVLTAEPAVADKYKSLNVSEFKKDFGDKWVSQGSVSACINGHVIFSFTDFPGYVSFCNTQGLCNTIMTATVEDGYLLFDTAAAGNYKITAQASLETVGISKLPALPSNSFLNDRNDWMNFKRYLIKAWKELCERAEVKFSDNLSEACALELTEIGNVNNAANILQPYAWIAPEKLQQITDESKKQLSQYLNILVNTTNLFRIVSWYKVYAGELLGVDDRYCVNVTFERTDSFLNLIFNKKDEFVECLVNNNTAGMEIIIKELLESWNIYDRIPSEKNKNKSCPDFNSLICNTMMFVEYVRDWNSDMKYVIKEINPVMVRFIETEKDTIEYTAYRIDDNEKVKEINATMNIDGHYFIIGSTKTKDGGITREPTKYSHASPEKSGLESGDTLRTWWRVDTSKGEVTAIMTLNEEGTWYGEVDFRNEEKNWMFYPVKYTIMNIFGMINYHVPSKDEITLPIYNIEGRIRMFF